MTVPPPPQSLSGQFRGIVEASLHGVVVQQDGRIVYANGAMAGLFGFSSPQEMIGLSTFDDFVAEEERPLLRAHGRGLSGRDG